VTLRAAELDQPANSASHRRRSSCISCTPSAARKTAGEIAGEVVDVDDHPMATLMALDVERPHAAGAHVRQVNGARRVRGDFAVSETAERRQLGFHRRAQMALRLALDAVLRLVPSRRHELRNLVNTGGMSHGHETRRTGIAVHEWPILNL
jgi:hypothetical protein